MPTEAAPKEPKSARDDLVTLQNQAAITAAMELRPDEARRIWKALIALQPVHIEPYVNLSRLERLSGSDHRLVLRELCANKTMPEEALTGGFSLLLSVGRSEEAFELSAVLQTCGRAPQELLLLLGETLTLRGRYRTALDALDAVLVKSPLHPRALTLTGLIYANSHEWGRARTALEAALQAGADFPELRITLGRVYLEGLLPNETLKVLERPDAGADPDSVLELRIRAALLIDWRQDTGALFRAFSSKERATRLRRELQGGPDSKWIRAAELELGELY